MYTNLLLSVTNKLSSSVFDNLKVENFTEKHNSLLL